MDLRNKPSFMLQNKGVRILFPDHIKDLILIAEQKVEAVSSFVAHQ